MDIEAYKGVFVYAQQVDNKLSGIAYELLGEAGRLAAPLNTQVTAVLIGYQVKDLADKLAEYGADRVIVVDDPELKEYRTEPYTHALASVINQYKPEIMKYVNVQEENGIAIITITREEALNALNNDVLADLEAAFDSLNLDTTRCAIVTGSGQKSFVAGADIAYMSR